MCERPGEADAPPGPPVDCLCFRLEESLGESVELGGSMAEGGIAPLTPPRLRLVRLEEEATGLFPPTPTPYAFICCCC